MGAAAVRGPCPVPILPSLSRVTTEGLTPRLCETGGQTEGSSTVPTPAHLPLQVAWTWSQVCSEDAGTRGESEDLQVTPHVPM